MGQCSPSNGLGTFGPNTDSQERIGAKERHPVETSVVWVFSKFPELIVPKKPLVCLLCHIWVFEQVRSNYFFFDMVHQTITEGPLFSTCETTFGRSRPHSQQFFLLTNPYIENYSGFFQLTLTLYRKSNPICLSESLMF